jgi:hypothetical protein
MQLLTAVLLYGLALPAPPQLSVQSLRDAVGSGNRQRVEALFARREDAGYLFEMAERRGGLRSLKASMIPAPPGWRDDGPYWVVFSARQDIEQDHDPVHAVIQTENGLRVGPEIPEWRTQSARIRHVRADVDLMPSAGRVAVSSLAELAPTGLPGAPVFRLNANFDIELAFVDGTAREVVVASGDAVPSPEEGSVLRAGSLVIPWTSKPVQSMKLSYGAALRSDDEDKISSNAAYLTAWWTPSIGRLPHTSSVRVIAPSDWHVVSEGLPVSQEEAGFESIAVKGGTAVKIFKCDLPISYPKVVAGKYALAAEAKDANGRLFQAFHLEPVEPERGKRDVALMMEAVAFFEKKLAPFPFPGYACYDADTYYGIESYSYTLLNRRITTTFVTHEVGHTYFGGMAPSAYTRDTWNEGMTQYIDSVVFRNNQDGTLQNGLRTMSVKVPLSQMSVAHAYGSATYFRGAYVMKMLEAEIGQDNVLKGLSALVRGRRGKETIWADLRRYFEDASGKKLDWFWSQWIDRAEYPAVEIVDAEAIYREGKYSTYVTVQQKGTYAPFRLRFKVHVRSASGVLAEREVLLLGNRESFRLDTDAKPSEAALDVFPLALASAGPARRVR